MVRALNRSHLSKLLLAEPFFQHLVEDLVQGPHHDKLSLFNSYFTVTDFAKFLDMSGFFPLFTAKKYANTWIGMMFTIAWAAPASGTLIHSSKTSWRSGPTPMMKAPRALSSMEL